LGTKILLHVAAARGGVAFWHPIVLKLLLHVAAAYHGVADVSSHIGAVPHLQPDAMVQGLHFTMFLSLGRIFVCAFTICC